MSPIRSQLDIKTKPIVPNIETQNPDRDQRLPPNWIQTLLFK